MTAGLVVELRRGFVGQDEGGAAEGRLGDRQPLLFPSGQLGGAVPLAPVEPELVDDGADLVLPGAADPCGVLQVLDDVQVRDQVVGGPLEDVADRARVATTAAVAADSWVTSTPAMRTAPAVGRSSVARICIKEDFPLPDGPTMAVTAPRGNIASTPRRACTSPLSAR